MKRSVTFEQAIVIEPILARAFARDTRRRLRGLKDAIEVRGILDHKQAET